MVLAVLCNPLGVVQRGKQEIWQKLSGIDTIEPANTTVLESISGILGFCKQSLTKKLSRNHFLSLNTDNLNCMEASQHSVR